MNGLTNSPIATWSTGGGAISNATGITVSTNYSEVTLSTLTFDPLRTSHSGQYRCDGILISQALDEPLRPSRMVELRVKSIK